MNWVFYVTLLTVSLYIQWDKFIIVQVTVSTPSNQVTSNFMLDFKRLRLNLLNILTLLTLKINIGDHNTRLTTIQTISKSKISKSTLTETGILFSQLSIHLKKTLSQIIHHRFFHVSLTRLKPTVRKLPTKGLPENIPDLE